MMLLSSGCTWLQHSVKLFKRCCYTQSNAACTKIANQFHSSCISNSSFLKRSGILYSSCVSKVFFQQLRHTTRGQDFRPNMYKRIKKHGRATRMKTINGKITLIRRMIRGVSKRNLTP